ncbi:uncharacterized protein LOC110996812 isoform X1 [Pieris rapae]|uniref:uncharacterized protein LOC110996812 isoform X1 n=1 Tax=Pieris rapae TaxID=64459 RepID=UPI001E280D54|nr:uncharacterized protein LOC110996812 isoform X1 [Pieris rapae]
MKWLIVIGLFIYVELTKGTAIPVPSQAPTKDSSIADTTEKEYINSEEFSTYEDVRLEAECLVGSEWLSNCHACRCSKEGRAICVKQDVCDKTYGEPLKCKPETSFKRDCNTCRCLDNGLVLCTMKGCSRGTILMKADLQSGKDCSPGTRWKSRCNDCLCSQEGLSNCTKLDCEGQENEPILRCAPDSMWRNECNTCWCTTNGHAMCTKMGCSLHTISDWKPQPAEEIDNRFLSSMSRQNAFHKIQRRSVCEPNAKFKVDCNDCFCSSNGEDISCTLKACFGESLEVTEQKDKLLRLIETSSFQGNLIKRPICKANTLFKVNCNECACAADGQSYSCSDDDCEDRVINDDVEVFMKEEGPDHIEHSVCKPLAEFHMGCNTCRCNGNGSNFSCTNKPCPLPEDVEIFKELEARKSVNASKVVCTANRMFIRDCNTCWCNDNGTGFFCTRKVCVLPEDGEENSENLRTIKKQCRPDEVFELDCNTCRCNSDGESYSCTRRVCVPEPDEENKNRRKRATSQQKPNPDSTPSRPAPTLKGAPKNCQPNQEFRLDCNKCLCDNEGQNYSCTRIDCAALNNNNGADRTKREVASQEQLNCTPGTVFDQGCNVCQCTTDGNHAVCSMKRCHDESENDINAPENDPNFRCNPGEQFKRGCKDCTCSADGRSTFCTLRLCDQDINPAL